MKKALNYEKIIKIPDRYFLTEAAFQRINQRNDDKVRYYSVNLLWKTRIVSGTLRGGKE
ncbi:MAG: hypothetical protein J6N52_09540 [Clostridia bacterium]|nr:hypothetical protein [Clostridia bacterium]